MNILDLLIVLLVLTAAVGGARSGFAVQLGSTVGGFAGLFLGAWVSTFVVRLTTDPVWRFWLVATTLLVGAGGLAAAGGRVGWRGAVLLDRAHLHKADAALGAVLSTVGALIATWLIAASLASVPQAGIGPLIQKSAIIEQLDAMLPPLPDVAARLGRLVDPLGLPRVFDGIEPGPAAPVDPPTSEEVQKAAKAATASMVRLKGTGCGGILIGSGFIVSPGLVMTSAHVIAGIAAPKVEQGTSTFAAVPVLFDPAVDIAVLRVKGLNGPALTFTPDLVNRGDVGAALGYPEGHGLTVTAAAVLDHYNAVGRDIYDSAVVVRPVIEIQAKILPGDSGGPLVLSNGLVGGVVFAKSVSNPDIGYAIASTAASSSLTAAQNAGQTVTTGACAAG